MDTKNITIDTEAYELLRKEKYENGTPHKEAASEAIKRAYKPKKE